MAGIDGCRGGWLCLLKNIEVGDITLHVLPNFDKLLAIDTPPTLVAVDIPIGLTEEGARICDIEARKILGKPRSNSVFPAPNRRVLSARTQSEASSIRQGIDGKKVSIQAWSIAPKIIEVDSFLRDGRAHAMEVREIHPELCYWAWNGCKPMSHPKRKPSGRAEREALVSTVYGGAYEAIRAIRVPSDYASDDILDAFAALWTAERLLRGEAITIPATLPHDTHNLRMEMNA